MLSHKLKTFEPRSVSRCCAVELRIKFTDEIVRYHS